MIDFFPLGAVIFSLGKTRTYFAGGIPFKWISVSEL
jgi:hypothetical protein